MPTPGTRQDHTHPTEGHTPGHAHQWEPGYSSPRATSTRGQSQTPVRAPRTTPTRRGTCNFCGLQGHGEQERTAYRRFHCPAYGTTCTSCGRQNHTAQVCWQSDIEHESAIFEQVDTMLEGTLNHQTWNRHTKRWTPRKSQPQPCLEVTIAARREDFRQHGHTLRQETQALTVDATASGDDLPILRITASITGQETRQMIYFSRIASKLYLSLATCIDLMLLPDNFPHGMAVRETATRTQTRPMRPRAEHADLQTRTLAATPSGHTQQRASHSGQGHQGPLQSTPKTCSCPTRAQPPPRPTTLPFPATEANRGRLEYDDALLWSTSIEDALHQATEWLNICARNGITLNPDKFRFAQDEVEFAGFQIINTEVKPCNKYLRAITDFPIPNGITDIRAWFGLVNQVAFAFSMASVMAPFRALLKPSAQFTWTDDLQQAFEASRLKITSRIKEGVRQGTANMPGHGLEQGRGSGTGYSKNTASARPRRYSAAKTDGK